MSEADEHAEWFRLRNIMGVYCCRLPVWEVSRETWEKLGEDSKKSKEACQGTYDRSRLAS